ncbi:MAG: hypothetical protein GXY08_14425, partial [Ruminococcus sp.]|nr:hypothetical protein [Ruminococcus sp.]
MSIVSTENEPINAILQFVYALIKINYNYVTAVDGSAEMCIQAEKNIGQPVI